MKSVEPKKLYSLRADANALGGYLEAPSAKVIPTLAPVSLPPVGGLATARSAAFTLDEMVSCRSAYTRVLGQECCEDGSASILVTAVIEDLNILEVVRADRIVTQLSITLSDDSPGLGFSVSGTSFEGLRIGGHACRTTLNVNLQRPQPGQAAGGRLTWEEARQVGRVQGEGLLGGFKNASEDAPDWVVSRHRRMTSEPPASGGGYALASLVDRLDVAGDCRSHGHIVDIPGFGQILLGELLVTCDSVQLIGIRAHLCCPVPGKITVLLAGGGGTGDN
ncbi:MAG TPA: choice-of-anchor P family protein [Steroidobacteraceae bacterium]|nr:choice-of-anchor P family protein [Steroidobacteraceae bacterium]